MFPAPIRLYPVFEVGGHLHISRAQSGRLRRWYNISPAFGTSRTPSSSRLANAFGLIVAGSRYPRLISAQISWEIPVASVTWTRQCSIPSS